MPGPGSRIGPGGPFLVNPLEPEGLAAVQFDDADDSWWGGVQMGFASVPLAGAVAALSLAVAISGNFSKHQDEIEAKVIGQSDYQSVIPVGDEPLGYAFQNNDETIFAVAPQDNAGEWLPQVPAPPVAIAPLATTVDEAIFSAAVDEVYVWQAPFPPPAPVAVVFAEQGEFSPVIDEDYGWQAQWLQASPVGRSPWADDDFVVQPAAFVPDELYWQVPTPALVPANAPLWATTEDELPRVPLIGAGESWQVIPVGDDPSGWLFAADEPIVPQPVVGPGIDEVYWQQPVNPPVPLAAQPLSTTDEVVKTLALEADWQVWTPALIQAIAPVWLVGDDIVPQPNFVPEDDYWFQLRPDPVEVVVIEWPGTEAGGGGSAAVSPLNIVESDWQVWTPPLIAAQPLYLPDPEQTPGLVAQQYGSQSFSVVNQRAVSTTEIINWWQSDELPLVIPLHIVESDWQVWSPAFIAARPLFLPDPEQIPAGLVAPPLIEERDWQVWFPPLIAARPLWLPDPEQVPAGSLRGVANEEYWHTLKPIIPGPVVTVWTLDEFPLLSDPPVYGWGARSKVGSKTGRDPFQHIGSGTAAAADKNVGSGTAKAQNGKIGSEDA